MLIILEKKYFKKISKDYNVKSEYYFKEDEKEYCVVIIVSPRNKFQ